MHPYDEEYANRFWRVLVQVDRVFKEFRARFIGKSSPVHFFWGSFDLALTRHRDVFKQFFLALFSTKATSLSR